jgi:hypothetical protein
MYECLSSTSTNANHVEVRDNNMSGKDMARKKIYGVAGAKRYGGKKYGVAGAKRYGGKKDTAWPARKNMAGKRYAKRLGMAGAKRSSGQKIRKERYGGNSPITTIHFILPSTSTINNHHATTFGHDHEPPP